MCAAVAFEHGVLLVANKDDRTLGLVDPQAGRQVAAVSVAGTTGHEVTASADGRTAFVPIYGDSGVGKPGSDGRNIVVIDLASQRIVGEIDFGHGVRPHCILLGRNDGLLYVTTELENSISIIDPASLKVVGSIPTGQAESHMLAITPDGRRGYTANVGPGTVSVVDMQLRRTIDVIQVSQRVQRIAISVDGRHAFTSDQIKPQLALIDTAENRIGRWLALPAPGYGTAPTPDGRWLIVAMPRANQAAIVDLEALQVTHTVDVPAAPQEVLLHPDGGFAYISCDSSGKIAVLRTSDWAVETLIDAGNGADGLAWSVQKAIPPA